MIRRLLEAHYAEYRDDATAEQVEFWLLESRTPAMLIEVSARGWKDPRHRKRHQDRPQQLGGSSSVSAVAHQPGKRHRRQQADSGIARKCSLVRRNDQTALAEQASAHFASRT